MSYYFDEEQKKLLEEYYQTEQKVNPNVTTEKDDLIFVAKMGASDSIRGLTQMAAQLGVGTEEWEKSITEKQKRDQERLYAIFDNPEYGQKAFTTFMTSAVAADPIGYIPFVGWAKKAKTIKDVAKYGSVAGAMHSGMSYVDEDQQTITGMLANKDIKAGKLAGRLENVALGATLGYPLGALGGVGSNAIAALRKKPLPFPRRDSSKQTLKRTVEGKDPKGQIDMFDEQEMFDIPFDELDDEKAVELLVKTLQDEHKNGNKYIENVKQMWSKNFGEPLKNLIFQNWGTALGAYGAGIAGENAFTDEDSPMTQKMAVMMAFALAGGAGVRGVGKLKSPMISGREETVANLVSRMLVDNYGLSAKYLKNKNMLEIDENHISSRFLQVAEKANKLKPEERKVLYNMLIGEVEDDVKLVALKDEARDVIKEAGQMMVDFGLLNEKTFNKNLETYLHRTFAKNLTKQIDPNLDKTMRQLRFIGDELRPRGLVEEVSRTEWTKNKRNYLDEGWEILQDNKGKKLVIRRDYTKQERINMEEIEDAAFALAETGRLLSSDIALAKFYNNIANDIELAKPASELRKLLEVGENAKLKPTIKLETEDGTQVWKRVSKTELNTSDTYGNIKRLKDEDGNPLFGELGDVKKDYYVPQEIYDDLTRTFTIKNKEFAGFGKAHNNLLRLWKKSKTAWNPAVHFNNTTANFVMMDFADVDVKYLGYALEEMAKGRNSLLFREAQKHGIFDVGFKQRELSDFQSSLQKALTKISGNDDITGIANYSESLYKDNVLNKLKKGGQKGYDYTLGVLDDLYQFEDQIFRMATFIDRTAKGNDFIDAAMDSKRWFIDYNINAPAINVLRNSVTPFLSYTYRVVPLLAETAIVKPWKVAKWGMIGWGLNKAGHQLGEGDEELERETLQQVKDEFSKTMWGRDFLPYTAIKLPFSSQAGDPLYVDVGRMMPGGDIFEQSGNVSSIEQLGPNIFGDVSRKIKTQISGGYLGDLIAAFIFKKDPFTLQDIDGLGLGEDVKASAKYFLNRSFIPNFPGLGAEELTDNWIQDSYSTQRIKKAMQLQEAGPGVYDSATQTRQSPMEAILYTLGLKTKAANLEKALILQQNELKTLLGNIRQEELKVIKSRDSESSKAQQLADLSQKRLMALAENKLYHDKLESIEQSPEYKKRMEIKEKLRNSDIDSSEREMLIEELRRTYYFQGGKVSEDFPVPNVKEEPSEMINKATGLPYEDEIGGIVNSLKKRKAMRDGGEVRQQYDVGDIVQGAISKVFIGASLEDMKKLQGNTRDFIDDAVDKGEIEEKERTKYPKGKFAETGEAYNAILHGRLAVRYGNKYPQSKLGLQGKEALQSKGILKGALYDRTEYGKANNWWTEPSDALNNEAGFNILDKNPNITPEEADKLLIKLYQTSRQKTKNGEPLIVGQDLFLTKEDYIKAGKPKINLFGN
tara:strand:- start:832 stop:5151 length:4320 start_codon:yes stop_codon:yes gene_type:complete